MGLAHTCRHHHIQVRRFATKYTARVTSATSNGRALAVEVRPYFLPTDAKGYPLPRHDLICKIAQILKPPSSAGDPFTDLSHYLETLTLHPLTPSEASLVLKSLTTNPRLSLQFFRFCSSRIPNFQHDSFTYNRLLLILSKAASAGSSEWVQQMLAVVDEMEKAGVRGSISSVNILVGALGGCEVERCMKLVHKWGLKLNAYTFKCILQSHLRSYESDKAYGVYLEMRRKGYKLDIFSYNMLLDALAKDDKVDQAYKVYEDMKRKHCEPDEFTYTIMIRMTGKINKADESLIFFQEMLNKGLTPNLMTYNTMLQSLSRARMVKKALLLFSKMVENNCRPNEFSYSIILNVLAAEGLLTKLDKVVESSKKYITKSIYAYLVRTLSKLGHANEAHCLFCNMWAFHDKGDRDAFMSMLESLCSAGKTAEAIDLLDKIHEKGVSINTMMYNTVLSALGRLKRVPPLHDLYERMKKDGPTPDIFSYNILISSLGRAGEVEAAVKVFEEMEESDVMPDTVSYNSLINCLGKNGDVDEAHIRFKEMQEKGLSPDVITYSTLIECFGKTDRVEMAYSLFDEMVKQGCSPNIVTYNILLDCLERTGRTGDAVDLYVKLKQQGLTPDRITYAVLERLQSGSHNVGRIRKQNPITGWIVSPLR
ncbi:hypothetical protein V2J09_011076 [Rumex salicifolius]